jgi:hypothetical protein
LALIVTIHADRDIFSVDIPVFESDNAFTNSSDLWWTLVMARIGGVAYILLDQPRMMRIMIRAKSSRLEPNSVIPAAYDELQAPQDGARQGVACSRRATPFPPVALYRGNSSNNRVTWSSCAQLTRNAS